MEALLPRLFTIFTALLWMNVVSPLAAVSPTRLMVDLSPTPDAVMLSAFDLCVVSAEAKVDWEAQQTLGNRMLARINLFEVPEKSFTVQVAKSIGVPTLESAQKGWTRLDATHPNWVPLVVREIVQHAAELGFDGFVLTGLETLSQDAERAACLQAIQELDRTYPDKQLILENGLSLAAEARRYLDGILFLGRPESLAWRDQRIREVKRHGLQPLVVDYLPAETSEAEIAQRAQHFRAMGATPFFTTPELNGTHLGPLKEVTRRVLVLHSGPPQDTFTARVLQGTLEWLGWSPLYLDPAKDGLAQAEPWLQASAVILDASYLPLPQQQVLLLERVREIKRHQTPLLITGAPWGNAQDFTQWSLELGLRGSGASHPVQTKSHFKHLESAWLHDLSPMKPRTAGFRDLQAPHDARILSSVRANGTHFDQVFLTSWGGVWLDALATQAGPQIAPLPFLESLLGSQPQAPVMDVASQNGRRLFIPIVESEGFTTPTALPGLPIAAEALTERLLSRYSLPFTVAICEGDVRGTHPGLDPRDALRYEAAAKTLFALPHIHAASNSLSRPENWTTCPEMEREIAGSLAYIHRRLLPAGHHVELMLWPQGIWPSTSAVAFSRRMGVENALIPHSSLMPGVSPVWQPLAWNRGDQHMTLAADLKQPSLRSAEFIAHAEAQNQGRWQQPVRAVFSFKDATTEETLWEAEQVLDWCASRPLQAISLPDHAKLIRDASHTRIFEQGPRHWILVNAGYARTLRLPAQAGLPDLDRSIGIAGYTVRGPDLYIHTLGRRRTELVLTPEGSPHHLRLLSASGKIRYDEAGQQRALLQVADLRPVELSFAGIEPGAVCQIFTTERPQFVTADARGEVAVTVPAQTTVRLQVLNGQQAAMR